MYSVNNNYLFTEKPKIKIYLLTSIAVITAILCLLFFVKYSGLQAKESFCHNLGYETSAMISEKEVCINLETTPMNYVEIECSGFLIQNCKKTSEEKTFEKLPGFSDYQVD